MVILSDAEAVIATNYSSIYVRARAIGRIQSHERVVGTFHHKQSVVLDGFAVQFDCMLGARCVFDRVPTEEPLRIEIRRDENSKTVYGDTTGAMLVKSAYDEVNRVFATGFYTRGNGELTALNVPKDKPWWIGIDRIEYGILGVANEYEDTVSSVKKMFPDKAKF